jgi:phosphatidylserine/phosphatidylglycerophosphate/cardiolipin synthase-like enzyme
VKVLFDNIEAYDSKGKPKGPWKKNQEAIAKAKIKSLCKGRENGRLMHNKFFVLSQNGQPKAVWTGSTNLTENGIFGHSNVGHIVEDDAIAQAFLDYWHRLDRDPAVADDYRNANIAATPAPPLPWNAATTAVFSPRGKDLDALEWYARIAGGAEGGLFMTFAFGMHEKFKNVYRKDDTILRMALLEKEGNNPKTLERDKKDIQEIRNRPNVVLAIGNRIVTNSFDRWLAELSKITPDVHVYWVHTKYMLVDPLSATPTVVSGSANFSKASTDTNDENVLVIRGDKRIADIYFGEFLRLYSHYAFREAVKWHMDKNSGTPKSWQPQFLVDDDKWMTPYFDATDTSARYARRVYFAGPMAV